MVEMAPEACLGGDGGARKQWLHEREQWLDVRRATEQQGRCSAVVQGRGREVRWWRGAVVARCGDGGAVVARCRGFTRQAAACGGVHRCGGWARERRQGGVCGRSKA
ncbi:hypothetical protein VNO80_05269 [Phaseolus coccineus]|uniref:Uncharacterized protein n=1 Tax=Phaseolus coccineus TaxID=3886 RepID=A0AAN9NJH8_PHACN